MWSRKNLKKEAKRLIKRNYIRIISVCFIMAVFTGAYYFTFRESNTKFDTANITLTGDSNFRIIEELIEETIYKDTHINENISAKYNRGVLANVFNNYTESGSFVFGVLNSINQFAFKGKVLAGIVLLVGAILSFMQWLFFGNILRIGEIRFLMENNKYKETKVNRILYIYKIKKTIHVAKIMFLKTIYTTLWAFTIVGGIIKYYSYRMVPYILAENPNISSKEVFDLSKNIMQGNKWKLFKLDFSFILWSLLSAVTFGIIGYLFVNPYKSLTTANLYKRLRAKAIKDEIPNFTLLNDKYLFDDIDDNLVEYPIEKYTIKEHKRRKWITADYNRKYSIRNLILLFFSYSVVGWIWEVCVMLVQQGRFVNRGVFLGPWLPIYGAGGVLVLIVLKKFRHNKVITFILAALLCGIIEYATGWYLLKFKGLMWWEYQGYLLNINGLVCLEGILIFALGATVSIYFISPVLDNLFKKIPDKVLNIICLVLISLFAVDFIHSSIHPNVGKGITEV